AGAIAVRGARVHPHVWRHGVVAHACAAVVAGAAQALGAEGGGRCLTRLPISCTWGATRLMCGAVTALHWWWCWAISCGRLCASGKPVDAFVTETAMTRVQRRRLLFVGVLMVGLAASVGLTLNAVSQNLMYFYQPSEIAAGEVPLDTRLRVGGLVQPGAVKRSDDSLVVQFTLADCDASVPVRYKGILPCPFREGQAIIATGKFNAKYQFIADDVLAKHDASYMSPAVAEATSDDQGVSCMPADMNLQASR